MKESRETSVTTCKKAYILEEFYANRPIRIYEESSPLDKGRKTWLDSRSYKEGVERRTT